MSDNSSDTPRSRESRKNQQERAEDIAYTINHALVCAATDIIDPFVAAWSQKYLGKTLNTSFCNKTHDHGHHHGHHEHGHHEHGHHEHGHHEHGHHGHEHHEHAITFGGALKHWVIGEAIGDIGAVPVAIAFQRLAPGFMEWVGHNMESVLGPAYQRGAKQAAEAWGKDQGLLPNDPKVVAHEDYLYRHEVKHFGQVAVWTVSSVGLNLMSQKWITGNQHPVAFMLLYKTLGSSISAALLLGGRAYAPETFQSWDRWTGKNILSPASDAIDTLLGVKREEKNLLIEEGKQMDTPHSQARDEFIQQHNESKGITR